MKKLLKSSLYCISLKDSQLLPVLVLKLVWSDFQMDLTGLDMHLISELQIVLKFDPSGIFIS